MLAATVLGAVLLMLSAWPLMMSPMIFDSGESTEAWTIFAAIWFAPVVLIVGLVVGWIGFARSARGMVTFGLILAALPVIAAVGVLVMAGV
ncbi:MAG TPA: hypothetical protein VL971_10200 [Rhizomicrobium sp.]|nr:hypothetical protein [Rhizomicrobium sp.]